MPAEAPRPGDRERIDRLHMLRSGPADGPRRLGEPARALAQQLAAGKALRSVAGTPAGDEQPDARLSRAHAIATACCLRFAFRCTPWPSANPMIARDHGPAWRVVRCAPAGRCPC